MADWREFIASQVGGAGRSLADSGGTAPAGQYEALATGPALVARHERALLEISGRDRTAWLHNLTTNQVKTLNVGEGNYAFVLNVQGRILFDVNVLVRGDSIWVDLDRQFLEAAKKHFAKYTITEEVVIRDRTTDFARLALAGKAAGEVATALGAAHAPAMAQLSVGQLREPTLGLEIPFVRHDFCGPFGIEVFVPQERAVELWTVLCERWHAIPVGDAAVQVRRIEAGIPWPGREITIEYLPAETRQHDRAVSFQKGCYLGQEVVERMRSRHVVARQLVGLRIEGSAIPDLKSQISDQDGKPVGEVTSTCHSPLLNAPVALGYIKTALSNPGSRLTVMAGGAALPAVVTGLPFAP